MGVTLSVGIACYNESETIAQVVRLVAAQYPLVRQIIIVNDGSTDETHGCLERIRETWTDNGVSLSVTHFSENHGKGAGIRAALAKANQPYFLIQDGDLELDPSDYARLVEPVVRGNALAVFGNRFPNGFPRTLHPVSRLANRIVTLFSNVLYRLSLEDQACCYKLLPTSLARELNLTADGFEMCSEMTAKLGRRHVSIANVPVSYHPRTRREGKKIHWRDGFIAVYTLLKHRL
jgi:dolichol-phosphate mannosyltransferase